MPGKVQRKYVGETMRIQKSFKRSLYTLGELLPCQYNRNDLLNLFREFYPFEWEKIVERCNQSREKDSFLKSVGKKERYKTPSAERFFFGMPVVKNILSPRFMAKHKEAFDEKIQTEKYSILKKRRDAKNIELKQRIAKHTALMQNVEPYYVDALIAAYHQRGITTEGKVEIVKEMGKFICDKSLEFFYKINDAERNDQIRKIAFKHLQDSGRYVKLRKKFSGKKKIYMTEKADFNMTPVDLAKRLEADTIQNIKTFGAFISHSYKDTAIVKQVISILNKKGISCYCDWSSDNDFLKRSLVSDYTKEVLKKRIEQSNNLLFIRTSNSMTGEKLNSPWIEMELEYCEVIGKTIYCINLTDDETILPFKMLNHNLANERIDWNE